MTQRLDTWTIWQEGGGLTQAEAERLFGPRRTAQSLGQGQRGYGVLWRNIVNALGSQQLAARTFSRSHLELESALLLKADDGSWIPVVTNTSSTYRLLGENQARDLLSSPMTTEKEIKSALDEIAPAGGFRTESDGATMTEKAGEKLDVVREKVNTFTQSAPVQATATVVGVGAAVWTGVELIKNFFPGGDE